MKKFSLLCFISVILVHSDIASSYPRKRSTKSLLDQIRSCQDTVLCAHGVNRMQPLCDIWKDTRQCMVDADCPDFIIHNAESEFSRLAGHKCEGMAENPVGVCKSLLTLKACVMGRISMLDSPCQRWFKLLNCYNEAECPIELIQRMESVFTEAHGVNCSSPQQMETEFDAEELETQEPTIEDSMEYIMEKADDEEKEIVKAAADDIGKKYRPKEEEEGEAAAAAAAEAENIDYIIQELETGRNGEDGSVRREDDTEDESELARKALKEQKATKRRESKAHQNGSPRSSAQLFVLTFLLCLSGLTAAP